VRPAAAMWLLFLRLPQISRRKRTSSRALRKRSIVPISIWKAELQAAPLHQELSVLSVESAAHVN